MIHYTDWIKNGIKKKKIKQSCLTQESISSLQWVRCGLCFVLCNIHAAEILDRCLSLPSRTYSLLLTNFPGRKITFQRHGIEITMVTLRLVIITWLRSWVLLFVRCGLCFVLCNIHFNDETGVKERMIFFLY
jgi:hypothetical protein